MKKISWLFALTIFSYSAVAQKTAPLDGLYTFCRVWGFLKYYHPIVVKGKKDWDAEFIQKFKEFQEVKTKQEANDFYFSWIKQLGIIKPNRASRPKTLELNLNYNLKWLQDTSVFTPEVTSLLLSIQKAYHFRKTHYAKISYLGFGAIRFTNEKAYPEVGYPSVEYRMLTLARYWNIINYFYPYKNLLDEDWNDTLEKFVPTIINAGDLSQYNEALLQLIACVNDSHVGLEPRIIQSLFPFHSAPFFTKIVGGKPVVAGILSDSICKKEDIRYGDVFLKINDERVEDILHRLSTYIPASNYDVFCRDIGYNFWQSLPDSINCLVERGGKVTNKTFSKNFPDESYFIRLAASLYRPKEPYVKLLDGNIGYLNLGRASRKKIKRDLDYVKNTKGLILDLRNYPSSLIHKRLINFLSNKRVAFARFFDNDLTIPGGYKWGKKNYCGKNHSAQYRGKVVVLINAETQSYAEYLLMALQTIPGVITVGSHTAGADGDRIPIPLPGNITTHISGRGICYPDGKVTQRTGIIPDVVIYPTINGMRSHSDEVLNKAIEIILEQK